MSKYKVGKVLKIKNGCEGECGISESSKGKFIRITSVTEDGNYRYEILDDNKKVVNNCSFCLKDEHLELYVKTLDDLEGGEMLVNTDGERSKVIARFGEYVLRTNVVGTLEYGDTKYETIKSLKNGGWKIDQPEEENHEQLKGLYKCKNCNKGYIAGYFIYCPWCGLKIVWED